MIVSKRLCTPLFSKLGNGGKLFQAVFDMNASNVRIAVVSLTNVLVYFLCNLYVSSLFSLQIRLGLQKMLFPR